MAYQEELYAYYSGGKPINRAAQIAAANAASARRLANQLAQRKRRPRQPVYSDSRGGDRRDNRPDSLPAALQPKPKLPPPPEPKKKPRDFLDLGIPGVVGMLTDPNTPDATTQYIGGEGGKPASILPNGTLEPVTLTPQVEPTQINRFSAMDPNQQEEVRKNYEKGNLAINRGDEGKGVTVDQMLDNVMKDPLATEELKTAAQELANGFREEARNKFFTNDDLIDNPLLTTLNDLSVWSVYRLQVAGWKERKKKAGETELGEEPGDGTFAGLIESGGFGNVTSPNSLPPYIVARDENGLLYVTTADKWIQAKFTDMHNDPALAAQVVTALAVTSMYGTDASANNQRSRVVVDNEGNPVKAIVGKEDLNALKDFALQAVMYQGMGDEVAIDDILAETVKLGFEVAAETEAAGDYAGGGRGGGGGFRGGFGGGGGGGGGSGAVRYTDATQLTAFVSSIARQRMGRELTPEEAALFVDYYHKMEEQQTAAYYAGQSNVQLDPEGQAVAWVTSHFGNSEAAAHQYGNLAFELFNMMGGSNPFAGVT